MSSVAVCNKILDMLVSTSFRFRPKTFEVFEKGKLLAETFIALDNEERRSAIIYQKPDVGAKLRSLSGYMAETAIETKDISWIKSAIVLNVIDDFEKDYRENYRYLVLAAYAAKEINVDFSLICSSIITFTSDRASSYLNGFIKRDDSLNKLAAVGIKVVEVDGKVRFVPM
jgi:hypothetical protein